MGRIAVQWKNPLLLAAIVGQYMLQNLITAHKTHNKTFTSKLVNVYLIYITLPCAKAQQVAICQKVHSKIVLNIIIVC